MPSEKVTAILRSKSPFTLDQIAVMSEAEAWNLVYQNPPAKKNHSHEICFTGFDMIERANLENSARGAGMQVKNSVSTTLSYLCVGETPGPSKVEKAKRQGVTLLNKNQFLELIHNGELPA